MEKLHAAGTVNGTRMALVQMSQENCPKTQYAFYIFPNVTFTLFRKKYLHNKDTTLLF